MTSFSYINEQLHAEQLPLTTLTEQYGTPLYVYSQTAIEQQFDAYLQGLGGHPGLICYAVKANSNLAVLDCLARRGAGFDIVSIGELERVVAAGGDPSKVVFSGVAKQTVEMQRALELGIHCFNVESEAELERLNRVAADMDVIAPVSFRVNPDVDAKTHPYISTGLKENKFGIDIQSAKSTYLKAAHMANINIIGIDCHIGSQLLEAKPFEDAIDRVLSLVDELSSLGIKLQHVDMGGGIGVKYSDSDVEPNVANYIQKLVNHLKSRKLALVLEPGRSIVANAGVLITQVEYLKDNGEHHFAIVDAGMNDLIRPSLYQAWMNILPVKENQNGHTAQWDIVGPVCETGDFLGKERALSLSENDLVAVMSAGAYGFVMASNYNTRPRAAEVMVKGSTSQLVRQRESLQDLWALETRLS